MSRMVRMITAACAMAALGLTGCKNSPPSSPSLAGPANGRLGDTLSYIAAATDPDAGDLAYQFDWGDTTTPDWTPAYPSGQPVTRTHVYTDSGVYTIKVKARDSKAAESDWSAPIEVAAVPHVAPIGLTLSAATDTTVLVSWSPPPGDAPAQYNVYFRDVRSGTFELKATTAATNYTHNPPGSTGQYVVSAVYGAIEKSCPDTATTIPVHTEQMSLAELNVAGHAGYGWDRVTGAGSTYNMSNASSVPFVDFYITDWTRGYDQTPYSIASPDGAPSDPGEIAPAGNWRVTSFTDPLIDVTNLLPAYSTRTYFSYTDINSNPTWIGCYTQDGHYALVELSDVNAVSGTVQVETWFQPVRGLRLIRH
jgi:hypothetical protein